MNLFKKLISKLSKKEQGDTAIIATKCNHQTAMLGEVKAFGGQTTTTMPVNKEGSTDWCLDCIGKMAIPCAWCGEVIFIGEPITLYTPRDPSYLLPEGAILYQEDPKQVVGCLRMNCADTGADRAGFWIPGEDGKGRIDRVASPLELAMASGKIVTVSHVGDPAEAASLVAGHITSPRP